MVKCSKCGDTYNESVNSKCPNCGADNWHNSNGRSDFSVRKTWKVSRKAPVLNVISVLVAIFTVVIVFAMFFVPSVKADAMTIISFAIFGFLLSFFLGCYAEHLEYMEHMTKQLEEIKEIIKTK